MNEKTKSAIRRLYDGAKPLTNGSLPELRRLGHVFGIPAYDLPKSHGGLDKSAVEIAEIFAYCGELDLDLRDLPGLGHARILLSAKNLSVEQQDLLGRAARGDEFVGVAITEEHTYDFGGQDCYSLGGSDLRGMKTVATPTEGGYLLDGAKSYVARLSQANSIVVFAKIGSNDDAAPLGAFVVQLTPERFPIIPLDEWDKTELQGVSLFNAVGLRGVSFGRIRFKMDFVSESMRINTAEDGIKLFNRHFEYWRTAMAAASIGCARGAVKQALDWLKQRRAFGSPIGGFTHLQQELSRHTAKLRMAWLLVLSTMQQIHDGQDAFVQAAMTKAEAVEIALEAADWSLKIHAAKGYTDQLDLEKRVRDLLGLRVADGATDLLRGQVARGLLGDDLYEMGLNRPRRSQTEHPLIVDELLG